MKTEHQKYKKHKEAWHKKRRKENKLRAVELLGDKCAGCGESFPYYIYDFHHIDPETKEWELSKLMNYPWAKVKKEAKKCILLCANCHRALHFKERH